jgi:tetratricopeptide (TPR) repeat protein
VLRLTLILATIAATLIGLGYLLHLNPEQVTLRLSSTSEWSAPLAILLFAVFLLGAATTFAFSLVRAGRHALVGWRAQRGARRARRQQLRKEEGLGLSWLGELDKARSLLAKALRDRPDDLAAFLLFARTYLDQGEHQRALDILQEGLDTRGPDPKLLLFLAEAQRGLGALPAAIETLERARRADPASPHVLEALRDAHAAAGRWRDAARVQEELLPLLHDPAARADAERRLVGMRYESALQHPEPAARIAALRALLRAHPDFEPAAVKLGDALLEAGQPRQAERVWRRALARGARSGVPARLERLLAGGPRARRLEALTRRLVRRHPEDGTARLFRARQLVRAGSLDEAAAELAQVTPPWNALAGYHALLAELHVRRGAQDDAVTAFRHALAAVALGTFRCQVCGRHADEWQGFCPGCRSWSSYRSSFEVVSGAASDGAGRPAAAPPALPARPQP